MNDKGARAVLNGKAKLGADASVAAGPVGRDAEASTNGAMSAEMLSYSRAQGVFAGVSLSGTSLGPDSGGKREDLRKESHRRTDICRQCTGTRISRTTAFNAAREVTRERFAWKVLIVRKPLLELEQFERIRDAATHPGQQRVLKQSAFLTEHATYGCCMSKVKVEGRNGKVNF
jgi:hypothetical protein